ncbi:leucine--tRNA ligase [Enterobacteriaceae endosymbiont of Plateumaris consimilis]|uniref:leucine--tRNA ligase n=1 Tax=Enterobacteriaceae endosymbiont of Plateumaris consimilis TaxID=2675794 RepID=UPI001449493F|nr:leucine--tRNA ligase [Enterobacteriaceae endosymbiont of Plateumaris consimilis]QJC28704.1 leucine--tRNA ligase [Enterobacteriaceae endosymbiont of Plateumaris consimilis]
MKKEYLPAEIESYVQKIWDINKTFKVTEDKHKKKFYCLSMLPYPSGKLHMGHVRNYTIGDVIARYQRMLGKNVLHPIGWDAFGLPAENAAMNNNIRPDIWTKNNIHYMKKQLKLLGFSYDWDREITTCHSDYYRWEQWFFLKLYNHGLVYKKISPVNWCPIDQTVLANEQVHKNRCWRCNSNVIKKSISQWFLKITTYAEELLNSLKTLHGWPQKVKTMQMNWIGKIEGLDINFNIFNSNDNIQVFIKNIYFYINICFIKILFNHPLLKKISYINTKINNFIKSCDLLLQDNNIEELSIDSGLFAINIITKKKIPILIVNKISHHYNIQATIGIPTHSKQDLIFAQKHNIPIIKNNNINLIVNNFNYNQKNIQLLTQYLIKQNIAKKKIYYRLKDWSISRQRLWGTPIPVVILNNKKIFPLKEKDLPISFPSEIFNNTQQNYSEKVNDNLDWFKYNLNGNKGIREIDTFDTFIESSWYYARYTCPKYNKEMLNRSSVKYWLPVDQYIGGIEHATMHLIYFRFFHKLMRDFKLLENDEPVKNLLCQGMVLADSFYYIDKNNKCHWISPVNVIVKKRDKNNNIIDVEDNTGRKLIYNGMIKMSKSKNNGIDPENIIKKYGADILRIFIMFAAPPSVSLKWKESGIKGMSRFLKKIWKFIFQHNKFNCNIKNINKQIFYSKINLKQRLLQEYINKIIIKVSNDIGKKQIFNTAISSIMLLVNKITKYKISNLEDHIIIHDALIVIIKMLYPFTPHFSFVLWKYIGNSNDIDNETWPVVINIQFDKKKSFNIIIQLNGKKKYIINIPYSYKNSKDNIKKYILNHKKILKLILNHNIIKTIYVPNKIFNIVIK